MAEINIHQYVKCPQTEYRKQDVEDCFQCKYFGGIKLIDGLLKTPYDKRTVICNYERKVWE